MSGASLSATPDVRRCGEWIGALFSFPSFVSDDAEPYRPMAVVWLEVDTGLVVGNELVRPGTEIDLAAGLFDKATRAPIAGEPRVPARVRVGNAAFADALRAGVGDAIEIVIAPIPEIDPLVAGFRAHMDDRDDRDDNDLTYLGPGITPEDVAQFFEAAARLYRVSPWDVVPPDGFIAVACDLIGIAAGALCVVGQAGESFGFALFRNEPDATRYVDGAESRAPGERPESVPAHVMFSYDRRAELGRTLTREIGAHRWNIAGPRAYPSVTFVDPDLVVRGLTRTELIGVTAVIEALAGFVADNDELAASWARGDRVSRNQAVPTALGDVAVELAAPLWLGSDDDPEQVELHRASNVLLEQFSAAPEAHREHLGWAAMLCDYAVDHFGALVHELSPAQLDDLLFETVPRKVGVEPEHAPVIIASLRAMLAFAGHTLGSDSARRSLAMLPPDASHRLARQLADPRSFGMAKSLVMAGLHAGFDMTSDAGIAAFLRASDHLPRAKTTSSAPKGSSARSARPRGTRGKCLVAEEASGLTPTSAATRRYRSGCARRTS